VDPAPDAANGRLRYRTAPSGEERTSDPRPVERGTFEALGLGRGRDGLVYIPDSAPTRGLPVLVFLHGAGGNAGRELRAVVAAADRYGVALVAPDSRGATWDVLEGGYGPDIEFLDRVLDRVAAVLPVGLLAVGGISDGASYALSVGLANGDLFEAVVAFSPGFAAPPTTHGRPRIFISHGTSDPVLPIDECSRRLVPLLRRGGYPVVFREFDGGHTVPPPVADEGLGWLVRPGTADAAGD